MWRPFTTIRCVKHCHPHKKPPSFSVFQLMLLVEGNPNDANISMVVDIREPLEIMESFKYFGLEVP